jgi:TPR repeat protein
LGHQLAGADARQPRGDVADADARGPVGDVAAERAASADLASPNDGEPATRAGPITGGDPGPAVWRVGRAARDLGGGASGAQVNLGVMYYNGQSVPQSHREAVTWLRRAAEQGTPSRSTTSGSCTTAEGVPQNHREAVAWFRRAAEQGDADAQYNLGVMYDNGEGVPQDDREAVAWYRRAAEQGNANAQYNLGVMYANGRGVPQDDREAVAWYRRAAEQGYADAQYNLGIMYAKGKGVPQDDREAVAWYPPRCRAGRYRCTNCTRQEQLLQFGE